MENKQIKMCTKCGGQAIFDYKLNLFLCSEDNCMLAEAPTKEQINKLIIGKPKPEEEIEVGVWLNMVKELGTKAKNMSKTKPAFLKNIDLLIKKENDRLEGLKEQWNLCLSERRELEGLNLKADMKRISALRIIEKDLKKLIDGRKYPEKIKISNEETFLRIYYGN